MKISDLRELLSDDTEVIVAGGILWSRVDYSGDAINIPDKLLDREVFQILAVPGENALPPIKIFLKDRSENEWHGKEEQRTLHKQAEERCSTASSWRTRGPWER